MTPSVAALVDTNLSEATCITDDVSSFVGLYICFSAFILS